MGTVIRYISCTDTAKLVRAQLKRFFPGVRFSVRSYSYSGGASIRVSWTDGPRAADVDRIVRNYEGQDFDGMNDLALPVTSWLLPSGAGRLAERPESYGGSKSLIVTDAPHPNAELVHFGADYVFTNRQISNFQQKHKAALAYVREHCHVEGEPPNDRFGNDYVTTLATAMVADMGENETLDAAFRRVVLRESA